LPAEYKNIAESGAQCFVNNKTALQSDSSYVLRTLNINKMYFLSVLALRKFWN